MNRLACQQFIRAKAIAGSHLFRCFVNADKRAEGWRMMQQAKRIAKRLNLELNLTEVA